MNKLWKSVILGLLTLRKRKVSEQVMQSNAGYMVDSVCGIINTPKRSKNKDTGATEFTGV